MKDAGLRPLWYALQVVPTKEETVATLLTYKGYEQYVPICKGNKHVKSKLKVADRKLFPGYVFCRFAYEEGDRVNRGGGVVTTPRVIKILGGTKPVAIPSEEIEAIRLALDAKLTPRPWPFQIGQKVKIETGPLRGISGIVIRSDGAYRLVLSIELLQRSVAAVVEPDWVSPAVTIGTALDNARTFLAGPQSQEHASRRAS